MHNLGYFDRTVVLNVDKRIKLQTPLAEKLTALGAKDLDFFMVGEGKLLPADEYDRFNEEPSKTWNAGPFSHLRNSYNAFLSYQDIIQKAKDDGLQSVVLFEDDVEFGENFDAVLHRGIDVADMLKLEWGLFYLGANHTWATTENIAQNLLRVWNSVCWHAVAVHSRAFETILNWNPDRPIDDKAKELHKQFDCIALWPNLATQKAGFSNVEQRYRDYSEFWVNKGSQN